MPDTAPAFPLPRHLKETLKAAFVRRFPGDRDGAKAFAKSVARAVESTAELSHLSPSRVAGAAPRAADVVRSFWQKQTLTAADADAAIAAPWFSRVVACFGGARAPISLRKTHLASRSKQQRFVGNRWTVVFQSKPAHKKG